MRVPTYDQPQEASRPLPGVRQESIASPSLFDAGAEATMRVGQALQSAGADFAKVAGAMQDRQNADMLFRAETAIKNEYVDYETSAKNRRGQDAWNVTKDTAKWWDDKLQQHNEGLENDAQRRLFNVSVQRLRTQSLDSLSTYESGERRRSLDESANASIVGSINFAAANWNNPDLVAAAKSDVLKRAQVRSQLNGDGPELSAGKTAEYLTNFHSQIIQNRVDKDPTGARGYYEANKGEINGSVQDKIEKVLKLGGVKAVAQQFADGVETRGLSEADAITEARKKFEGEQEDHAVLEIKTRFREKYEANELLQKKNGDIAYDIFAKTKNLNAVPASVLDGMDGKVRLSLEKEARDLAAGVGIKTDPHTYYDLRQMAVHELEKFQRLDLRQYFHKLDEGDREKFIDLQHPEKTKEAATLEAQLSSMHDQLGWGSSERDKKGNFDRVVSNAIDDEQRRRGKPLTYEERQKVIDRMIVDGKILNSGYLWDSRGKFYEFAGTEASANFQPKVPDADRQQIEAALKRAKKPVTDAEVLRIYRKANALP